MISTLNTTSATYTTIDDIQTVREELRNRTHIGFNSLPTFVLKEIKSPENDYMKTGVLRNSGRNLIWKIQAVCMAVLSVPALWLHCLSCQCLTLNFKEQLSQSWNVLALRHKMLHTLFNQQAKQFSATNNNAVSNVLVKNIDHSLLKREDLILCFVMENWKFCRPQFGVWGNWMFFFRNILTLRRSYNYIIKNISRLIFSLIETVPW